MLCPDHRGLAAPPEPGSQGPGGGASPDALATERRSDDPAGRGPPSRRDARSVMAQPRNRVARVILGVLPRLAGAGPASSLAIGEEAGSEFASRLFPGLGDASSASVSEWAPGPFV